MQIESNHSSDIDEGFSSWVTALVLIRRVKAILEHFIMEIYVFCSSINYSEATGEAQGSNFGLLFQNEPIHDE